MKRLGSMVGACLSAALLAACGGSESLSSGPTSIAPPIAVSETAVGSASRRATAGPDLYVANPPAFDVTVYAPGRRSVLRVISQGVTVPVALAFDGSGNLYVANSYHSSVTVYAPGSTSVLRTISYGIDSPTALAFDNSGKLNVANSGNNTVTAYAPGSTSVLKTISQGIDDPTALAFDASGNLYVLNALGGIDGTVTVYAPGKHIGAADDLRWPEQAGRAGICSLRYSLHRKLRQ